MDAVGVACRRPAARSNAPLQETPQSTYQAQHGCAATSDRFLCSSAAMLRFSSLCQASIVWYLMSSIWYLPSDIWCLVTKDIPL